LQLINEITEKTLGTNLNHMKSLWKVCSSNKSFYKQGFTDYQTVRRKYILTQISEKIGKDCMEPAPLLNVKLLDIGCGDVSMAQEMVFRGAEVTALDINEEVIESAKEKAQKAGAPMGFVNGRPEDMVASGETFDVLLCLDVLSYVEDKKRFIWAMHKLLNPNGVIIFSDHHSNFWSCIWHKLIAEKFAKWVPVSTYCWKQDTPKKAILDMLQANKFNVTDTQDISFDVEQQKWSKNGATAIRYMGMAEKI
jgi:2-polyprenyl-6-hydroxyphenyl methylase/3-demethylubiquinone-9 3-methyltransferase